jgi:phospholipid/cholesterol/gamma-HCH transport system ATP-binding protein
MSDEKAPVLEFRHVSLELGGAPVLADVSFALARRETVVVTGRSGSGKSVLLRTAIGFFAPTEGEVLVEGRHVESLDETELLALRSEKLGIVFQEDALFTGMSVYDNAAFRLVEHGWGEAETERAVAEILSFVGLERDAEKLPEELSIGMRRRLEIARALVGWPRLMLYDEPTAGLDPITAKRILELVVRARDVHGVSSLYVTKELHEIPFLANHMAEVLADGSVAFREGRPPGAPETRVMLLDHGRVALLGSPEEFAASRLPAALEMTHPETSAQARSRATAPERIVAPR